MSAPIDVIEKNLRCPRTGFPVRLHRGPSGELIRCEAVDDHGERLHQYPVVDNQPVLVDFATSVLDESEFRATGGASPISRRRKGAFALARRVVWGENQVAWQNACRLLREIRLGARPGERPVILVIGGGEKGSGTDPLYDSPDIDVIGFDIYTTPFTTFVADGHAIPLEDGSVHAVWIQAVLEHVIAPSVVVSEIHRVLAPGGWVYAETPFLQHVHEGAFDFTRYTESGHRYLFRGFCVEDSGPIAGPGTSCVWALRALLTGLCRSHRLGRILTLPFFWLRFLDRLIDREYGSDGACAVFFLGRRSEREATPQEVIGFYRGAQ